MNIIVPMKQIPDLQQIRIRNRQPLLEDVPKTFGKIDKNALETAVRLKEANGGEVVVASVGTEELEDTIKEAMAAGGDRSLLVTDEDAYHFDSSDVANILAEVIKKVDDAGLIIFGEGSGDNYSGQVGSRVAEILGYPQVGYVSEIKVNGNSALVTRALEDCLEVVEIQLPAVVIVVADLNEPRTPSVSQVLKAGKKPKEIYELDDLDTKISSKPIKTFSNLAPEVNRKRMSVKNVGQLLETLKAEGVIGR